MTIENSTNLILQTVEGDGERGGWQGTGSFANAQANAVYGRRTDIYFTPEGDGVWEDDPVLGLRGAIIPQSTRFNIRQSHTTIAIATTDFFLANAGLQGIYFTDVDPPTHPHQYADLRLGTIVKHIIEQHTNISSTAFVQNSDGTFSTDPVGGWADTSNIDTIVSTKVDVYTVRQSNSLWQTIKDIARNEFYVAYFTKRDEFIYEPHPVFAAVTPAITLTIDQSMMVGEPEIIFRDKVQMDQAVLMALTDDGEILRSSFPATIGTDGRKMSLTNLRCNTQPRLNQLAQRVYSFESRPYDLRVFLAGPWGLYLELFDRISFTYSGTSRNGIDLSFSAEPFYIDKIRVGRIGNFGAITELLLQQENISGTLYAT